MRPEGLSWLVAAALGAACVTAGPGTAPAGPPSLPGGAEAVAQAQRTSAFPTAAELAALGRGPAGALAAGEDPSAWPVEGPPAQPARGERRPQSGWERLLAARTSSGGPRLTEPMSCLAGLVGRFHLERGGLPGQNLLTFLAARCGVPDPRLSFSQVEQPLRGGESEPDIERRLRPEVERMLGEGLGPDRAAGIWYGRNGARAVVMLVLAEPAVRLETLSLVPDAALRVEVRGEVLLPAQKLRALIGRGRFGFRECAIDPAVALPRFAVECPADAADSREMLEIAAFPEGYVLGPVVVREYVWPGGAPPDAFLSPLLDLPPPAADGDLRGALFELVNRVRQQAEVPPLTLAEAQSDTAADLAPAFFAAEGRQDLARADAVGLGMMAGWQVPGLVRSGQFTAVSNEVAGGDAAGAVALLGAALERPSAREVLLRADARALALGAVRQGGKVGVLFGTYRLFDPGEGEEEAARLIRRIDASRGERGLPPARPLEEAAREIRAMVRDLEGGEAALGGKPGQLSEAAARSLGRRGGKAFGWVAFATDLDEFPLPALLTEAVDLRLSVGVAHCRRSGSPWAGYCVLIAAARGVRTVAASPACAPRGSSG